MSRISWFWACGAVFKGFLGLALGLVVVTASAALPPGTFEADNKTVTVDGNPVGEGGPWGTTSLRNTVIYDQGRFHLWFVTKDFLSSVTYATSIDGIHFEAAGTLSPPDSWWLVPWLGMTAEKQPVANFLRVEKRGADWVLMVWHPNFSPSEWDQGAFNYNTSMWKIGPDISNLDIELIGPLSGSAASPQSPAGDHVGPAGIVGNEVYLIREHTNASLGRYTLTSSALVSPSLGVDADLYTGTGWCAAYQADCVNSNAAYIYNKARVLKNSGKLTLVYSLRKRYDPDGNAYSQPPPVAQQLFYVESSDDGISWGEPQAVFPSPGAFMVDGHTLPDYGAAQGGYGFSGPEVVALGGGAFRGYFDTEDANGRFVMVTSALPTPPPAPAQISPVPVMGPWGLALLIVLAGGGAGLGLRHRRGF